jgi:hypothetical protein
MDRKVFKCSHDGELNYITQHAFVSATLTNSIKEVPSLKFDTAVVNPDLVV